MVFQNTISWIYGFVDIRVHYHASNILLVCGHNRNIPSGSYIIFVFPRSTEPEKQSSKRYDTSDLYKPHRTFPSTRRQGSSPGAASTVTTATTPSSDDGNKVRSSLDDTSPISSRSTSPSSLIRQTSPISSSSASFSSRSHKSRSRSNSSSSTGSHHSRGSGRKSVSGTSSSSVDEFGRRKRKNLKMPIYMVDFGEAARQAKTSLIDVNFGEAERWVQQQGSR